MEPSQQQLLLNREINDNIHALLLFLEKALALRTSLTEAGFEVDATDSFIHVLLDKLKETK
jgi:hypothetical protein